MRTAVLIPLCLLSLVTVSPVRAQSDNLTPLKERVNVQADSARTNQIIDGRWVAVGTNKPDVYKRQGIQSSFSVH